MELPDKKDLKIIGTIADQAHLPYTAIGKLTKISKDSITARVQRLLQDNW